MNTNDIRLLAFYFIPKDWNIHLIDRHTNENQLELIRRIIEDARLFAFDTETMPSFYRPMPASNSKPSLLQVAVRDQHRSGKTVLLFDLQELFDRFRPCETILIIHNLIELIFHHPHAYKLSQSFFNDLAQLKCSYDDACFHRVKLHRLIELSDLYRQVFPEEKEQKIYGLQRMTAMTLHCQLNKKQQCANWSKRPLTQALKDYAAMDVIVMIDIYERLKTRISENQQWESFRQLIITSIDLTDIILYSCSCGERFISNKTRNKHARTCHQAAQLSEKKSVSPLPELDYDALPPRGRGYIPPALKRAYQIPSYEQIRCSSALEQVNQWSENRPPDAQFFLEDDDTEVAQAFGIQLSKPKPKQEVKIAAYPPRNFVSGENVLLERLQDDFDSQPEFHCHLFGLGGRGRSISTYSSSPPEPGFIRHNDR